MATTTNMSNLHLRLARIINDPVATGATAGNILSVLQRDDYINRAIYIIVREIWQSEKNKNNLRTRLGSMIIDQTINPIASAGTSVATGYINMPLAFVKTSDTTIFTYHPVKEDLDNAVNSNLSNSFTISGGKLYVYQSGVILNAGTGTFSFIGIVDGAESTTDITIGKEYHDQTVQLAAMLFSMEVGDLESAQTFKQETK